MSHTQVSLSEFQRSFGQICEQARHEPVVISKNGQDFLVVMAADEWKRLNRRDRKAGLTSELSNEWIDAVSQTPS